MSQQHRKYTFGKRPFSIATYFGFGISAGS
jgi:hypothetical protein